MRQIIVVAVLIICMCTHIHIISAGMWSAEESYVNRQIKLRSEEIIGSVRREQRTLHDSQGVCLGAACSTDDECVTVMYSNGTEVEAHCVLGACTAYPVPSAPLGSKCTMDNQCKDYFCYNGVCSQPLSMGCACGNSAQCAENLLCVSGTCQSYRQNGDKCSTSEQCPGACVGGVCARIPWNGNCKTSLGCEAGFYCDAYGTCSPTAIQCGAGNKAGYCPPIAANRSEGECVAAANGVDGMCAYPLAKWEKEPCNADYYECAVGLACVDSVCIRRAEGTPCSSYQDCNALTQDCYCLGGDATPTCRSVYLGAPDTKCGANVQDSIACNSKCGPSLSTQKYNYPCLQKCAQSVLDNTCCLLCETFVNVGTFTNVNGTCASSTSLVNCCSATKYCAEPSKDSLCVGIDPPTTGTVTTTTTTSGNTTQSSTTGTSTTSQSGTTSFVSTTSVSGTTSSVSTSSSSSSSVSSSTTGIIISTSTTGNNYTSSTGKVSTTSFSSTSASTSTSSSTTGNKTTTGDVSTTQNINVTTTTGEHSTTGKNVTSSTTNSGTSTGNHTSSSTTHVSTTSQTHSTSTGTTGETSTTGNKPVSSTTTTHRSSGSETTGPDHLNMGESLSVSVFGLIICVALSMVL